MARDLKTAGLDGGIPEAIMAMGRHMIESPTSLFGDLAKCDNPIAASETVTRWVGRCIREFGTDQARLMDAYANSLAQVTAFTRETLTSFNAGAAVATSRPKTEA
jgi:hypothetical protein